MRTSDRTIALLRLFTMERPEWTVEEAAGALGMTVSTAYRHFRSLSENGFISTYSTGKYVLGPAFMKYDRQIRLLDPLLIAAAPVMDEMTRRLPHSTVLLLCKLYNLEVMCIDQRQPRSATFSSSYERGLPMPLHLGAASKVILANLPSRTTKKLYLKAPEEMAAAGLGRSWDQVSGTLREIRTQQIFVAEGELLSGVQGIGAPILSGKRQVLGSIATVRAAGTPAEVTDTIKGVLSAAANRISDAIRSA
jgi:DNA-binding IclR family transcriptional regulator